MVEVNASFYIKSLVKPVGSSEKKTSILVIKVFNAVIYYFPENTQCWSFNGEHCLQNNFNSALLSLCKEQNLSHSRYAKGLIGSADFQPCGNV